MCVPGCLEKVERRLVSRRTFFGGAAAGVAAGAAMAMPRGPAFGQEGVTFNRVVDLTHTLPPDFPHFYGRPGLELIELVNYEDDGFNGLAWELNEHTGTHIDAPIHFSRDGQSCDEIPIDNLVVPIIVIDVRAKAETNPDYELTPDDIQAWIDEHGPIPQGACVAMNAGWDRHATGPKFRNADDDGVMHFPAFHVEAARMLMEEADVVGIAVDTLSLDHGPSQTFDTHYAWLPSNRWGMECVANLSELPPRGATVVVGSPTVKGATGGPTRMVALV